MNKEDKMLVGGLVLIVALVALATMYFVGTANAHYYDGCRKAPCKKHVIKPLKRSFLGPVGACESGTGSYNLRVGLRAISPGGTYRGRYQFGWPDWARARGVRISGVRDASRAGWLDQAYVAVIWLHRNGRGSWPNC